MLQIHWGNFRPSGIRLTFEQDNISGRPGLPAPLIFIFVGIPAGSEGSGGIHFDDPAIAQSTGVVALALNVMRFGSFCFAFRCFFLRFLSRSKQK